MNSLRVCHMTSAHPPEDVRIFHKECTSLAQAGYEVYLVERGESYEKNGVHIVGVGEIPQARIKRMTEGARRVYERALALDCDIYHLHDPELLPYALKLKKKGKKVVFDSHELYRKQIAEKGYLPRWIMQLIAVVYSAYERHVLQRIDGVIFPCLSNGEFPLPGKRKVTANNFPRLDELYNAYDPNVKKEENSICMVGTLSYARGVTHLIKAARVANCAAYIGGTSNSAAYEQEIRQMPEAENTRFLGHLDRDQVRELLQKSKIGIAALLNIGQYGTAGNLPTKAYEYMAMGIPVILSKTPYNEEVVQRYKFGICIDPENIEEYAGAIRYLLDHPDIAEEMGQNGRQAIKESFNWEREAQRISGLYQELLSSK